MRDEEKLSDELINAFVDGELDAEARAELLGDEDQDSRLCEARRLKELVRHAYGSVPECRPGEVPRAGGHLLRNSAAALVFIFFGALTGGWFFGSTQENGLRGHLESPQMAQAFSSQNTLVHITSDDQATMAAALDYAEAIFAEAQLTGVTRRVEIVANEGGLNLLRSDVSPFSDRIREMSRENQELVFYACGRAIERLEENGVEVILVPDARIVRSALDQVVERMQEGWEYHRI